jgi:acyl-coenzyme A thioesterase 13
MRNSFLGGVTRTLNISYLRAIPVGTYPLPSLLHPSTSNPKTGTTIRLHSKVMQVGRTMAMIRGTMSTQDGKTVYCTCEHHKVAVPTRKEHLEHRVEWDEVWERKGKEAKL